MKIVLYAAPRVYGGLLKHVELLAEGLSERHDVTILVPEALMNALEESRARCTYVDGCIVRGKFDFRRFFRLARFLREARPDIFHVHLSSPGESTLAFVAASLSKIPAVIATEHSPSYFPLRKPYSGMVKRFIIRYINGIITLNQPARNLLIQRYSIDAEKIRVVHNGIKKMREVSGREKDELKSELGITGDCHVITVISEMTERKGIGLFLDVAATLIKEGSNARFLLIGEGGLKEKYESIYTAYVRDGRIIFTGYRQDVAPYLAISDIFALPSSGEEMPMSILEAMACGVPVIASLVGGVPEIIKHAENGLLIQPNSASELYSAIDHLMKDRDLARRLALRAFDDIESRFSLSRMVNMTEEIYSSALKKKETC